MFAQVIVDIVHEAVDRTFTYRIPDDMTLTAGQRVRVPFRYGEVDGIVLALTETCDLQPEKIRNVIRPLEQYSAILPHMLDLSREMADTSHCPLAETLRLMIPPQMRRDQVKPRKVVQAALAIATDGVAEAREKQGRSSRRKMILSLLSDGKTHSATEIGEIIHQPLPDLRHLQGQGLIRMWEEEVYRLPGAAGPSEIAPDPVLTDEQTEVLETVLPYLQKGTGSFLLHGVTGSGKTEVFIRLVRRTLEMGRSAMILVPEIALTPQMVDWFRRRFGTGAAVLHSRLSDGERFDEWRRIRYGQARVVIGARSAVFAPAEHLGLIIVDEEHENSYISDRHPRYDARDVARSRAEREHATLLLASATPSITSFYRAKQGDYIMLEMPHRVGNRPLPEVEVVDMRRELELGNRSVFSQSLKRKLLNCVSQGQQAMLLLNRRGYHSFVTCRSCGKTIKCDKCDVAMTLHLVRGDGQLHCHYCGATRPNPTRCPECDSPKIRYFGTGTQMVEEELKRLLPGVPVGRMDVDTTSGKDGHARVLDAFRRGDTRVLVGTQMIAKGLDFPEVTLVGVVAADITLNLPDYRSQERTFQLLTQVAGRAGRGQKAGQVVIQTYSPEHEVIVQAAAQDYRAFFTREIQRRQVAMYPPFSVMARLLVESEQALAAEARAAELYRRVENMLAEHPDWEAVRLLLSLEQPPLTMLRGRNRWQVLMKLRVGEHTEAFCAALSELAREPAEHVETFFEYNPVSTI